MKIHVDRELCQCNQMCVRVAPDAFAIDDDGVAISILAVEPDEALRSAIREAVELCPFEAISIQ